MTNYDKIKAMSIDELSKFLDTNWTHEDDPCSEWWLMMNGLRESLVKKE